MKIRVRAASMKLPGIVTNVTAFGAFVDAGVHQDGLVHVSQLADTLVKEPNEIVKVGQKVQVAEVDLTRQRIAPGMKSKPDFTERNACPAKPWAAPLGSARRQPLV